MRAQVAWFGLLAACLIGSPARADVIFGPPDGYTEVEELGEVELEAEYGTPNGVPYRASFRPPYGLVARAVSWAPEDLPVLIFIQRNRGGFWLFLGSTLRDRRGRNPCWSQRPIAARHSRSPQRLWQQLRRAFDGWVTDCPTMQTLGEEVVRSRFLALGRDFQRGLVGLASARSGRFVPGERDVGMPSFLPARVSQPLLDAVAEACGGPRDRLRLQPDGTIAFDFNPRVPYGADGSLPFDSCVNEQIRYFPGYRAVR